MSPVSGCGMRAVAMMRAKKEVSPGIGPGATNTDSHHATDTSQCNGDGRQGTSPGGDIGYGLTSCGHPWGIGITLLADDERQFVIDLDRLRVPLWVAGPGGKEFSRLSGWQQANWWWNCCRVGGWNPERCLCANTGGSIAVVDVDPRNGGDIEAVPQLLAGLNVAIFAEVATPGGGRHFYVAGHKALPSAHQIPGFPGVDVQSKGCHVFLPGTRRPKYDGRGYAIVFNELAELVSP